MVPVATAIDTAREGECPTPDSTVGDPGNYTTTAGATQCAERPERFTINPAHHSMGLNS